MLQNQDTILLRGRDTEQPLRNVVESAGRRFPSRMVKGELPRRRSVLHLGFGLYPKEVMSSSLRTLWDFTRTLYGYNPEKRTQQQYAMSG